MKSKSFNLPKATMNNLKQNRTPDFINFYKPAAENGVNLVKKHKENVISNDLHTPERPQRTNKKKKKIRNDSMDISNINIDGNNLSNETESSHIIVSKVTSTPNVDTTDLQTKIKPIIKNKYLPNNSLNVSKVNKSDIKPKKRNKSVSFVLDDKEGVAIKRSKSEETVRQSEKPFIKTMKHKKPKMKPQKQEGEKENNVEILTTDIPPSEETIPSKKSSELLRVREIENQTNKKSEKRKHKKHVPTKYTALQVENHPDIDMEEVGVVKRKKIKKKKHHLQSAETGNMQTEGEPINKSHKKDSKSDKIAQELENLNIGDNAHTLANILDDMTVVDKNKKRKNKVKNKQQKNQTLSQLSNTDNASNNVEEKENVKSVKRRWNKNKKGAMIAYKLLNSIIVENLPLKIMFSYKKILKEYFEKFGLIKHVGIAEVYPTEDPKPVFTTTITFYSKDAAEKALEQDNCLFEGVRIQIKSPLPPTLTTLVVRSYGELTQQALSSVFSTAGRIRNMRNIVKGKKSSGTAFIEFDGPESVNRAIEMAEEAKIGGKKIHVAKFDDSRVANKKTSKDKTDDENAGSDNCSD